MSWKSFLARSLGFAHGTRRRDSDLRSEIQSHIELETDANIERGIPSSDAHRLAVLKFGNPQLVFESSHAMWSLSSLESILADIKFCWRVLWKKPLFATVAIVTLAIGIGSSTAVFTIANAVLFRAMPYPESNRIVLLWGTGARTADRGQVSFTDTEDIRRRNRFFSAISNYADWTPTLSGYGDPERLAATQVSDGFFDVIGVKPAIGRPFLPEENIDGRDRVVILSHELWVRKFNADPSIVGRAILLNTVPHVVVGVMPQGFEALPTTLVQGGSLYRPIGENYDDSQRRSEHLRAMARLKPGATAQQAQSDVERIARELEQEHPKEDADIHYRVASLQDDTALDLKPSLSILTLAVLLLLVSACANLAGLLLARSSARRREFAMRSALGASRQRILRQLLTESLILGCLGGLLGMGLAYSAARISIALAPKLGSQLTHVAIDARAFAFCFCAVILTSIFFGLAPALRSTRLNLSDALKQSGQTSEVGKDSRAFQSAIVVGELALALTLLTVGSLLIQTFVQLRKVDLGFQPEGRLLMNVWLPYARYQEPSRNVPFYEELSRRVEAIPGVTSVALVQNPPLGSFDGRAILPEGKADLPQNLLSPQGYFVTPKYFSTMGISLLSGRQFTSADNESSQLVAIVSQNLANRMFPGENPIGHKLQIYSDKKINGRYPDRVIVGVVADVRHLGPDGRETQGVYIPFRQLAGTFMTLIVRCESPSTVAATVRQELRSLDPDVAAFRIGTYAEFLGDSLLIRRVAMLLVCGFGVTSLFLAGVGIYGLLSYAVSLRMKEFGVRSALGALPRHLISLVIGSGIRLLLFGAILGAILSAIAARITAALLTELPRLNSASFAASLVLLALVVLCACALPARMASRANPATTLRGD